ncbi:MAG TPA: nucleoside triphosphate pyrophosphohydrolase, partial [Rhodospirillaceae bacterium]|nr:nucleoside triphosphate pyrophosphohydrolase [Rhodospirillaceae bacterium]
DRLEDEMGDILFVSANLARMLKVDPEKALARTNRKFEMRFRAIEAAVAAEGKRIEDVPLAELDRHWIAAKGVEKQ